MSQSVLTKTAALAWSLLESYDIDPLPLFRKAHIDPASMEDMSSRTNWSTQNALWQSVADSIEDPCFGLKVGKFWHPSHMHALGDAWLSSSTLYSALERLSRFIKIVNSNIVLNLSKSNDQVSIEVVTASETDGRKASWYADMDMSILMAMCRANFGDTLNPVSIDFMHEEPVCAGEFYALFRCPVNFGADRNRMMLSRKDADRRLPGSNKLMSQVHDQEIVRYLAGMNDGDIVHKVKNAILELLPDGRMSDIKVAETLFMSNRNLQRKLEAQGTTFKTILTDLRKELATKYIKDTQLTLTEISFMLGFSEMSAFSRAFKQWTGESPKAHRPPTLVSNPNPNQ
jgi:AraC-like DNA-binding protein